MILAVKQYKWFLLAAIVFAVGAVFMAQPVAATTTDNLSGFAWSDNVGWISFNDTNPPTGGAPYGVDVSLTGIITGNAWVNPEDTFAGAMLSPWMATDSTTKTDNIGWLSFNIADTTGCPSAPCQATLNKSTGQVTGWARFMLKGELQYNGWVHLSGTATDGSSYGVQVTGCQWDGYAWSEDFGWIHFLGASYNVTGSGDACVAAYNYSVDAPNTTTTITKSASGSINVPIGAIVSKLAGSTNEVVTVYDVTGEPSGVTGSVSGASCTPTQSTPCTATILLSVGSAAPAGATVHTLTVLARSASGLEKTDTFTIVIQNPTAFDFSLSRNPTSLTYTAPATKTSTITVTRVAGTAANVNLSATVTNSSGAVVSGITTSFAPTACVPSTGTCASTLSATVPSGTPDGPYTVNVSGVNGSTTRNTTVQLCVSFCSTFDYRVDAPSTATVVTKSATAAVSQNIPVTFTRLAGTGELITITSVTGLPSGVTETLTGASCTPTSATPCSVTRALSIGTGATVGTVTVTINAQAAGGRTRSDTFVLTIDPAPAPAVNYTVAPSNPPTVTDYQTAYRSNVRFTWLSPLSPSTAIERVRLNDVSFASAIATAGISSVFAPSTNCLPILSSGAYTCTLPLDVIVGATVPDGAYSGTVCGRSLTTLTRKCGSFTVTVDVNGPIGDLQGKKTGDVTYVNGPITVPSGSTVDLRWTSDDAASCQLSAGSVDLGAPGISGTYTTGALTAGITYTLTCDNPNGTDTDTFRVDVTAPPTFDFSLSRNPTSLAYTTLPATRTSTITVTRVAGTAANVNLSATVVDATTAPVPSIVPTFSPTSCTPSSGTCTSVMSVPVPAGTTDGAYTVRVRGVSGSLTRNTTVSLCVGYCGTFDYTVNAPTSISVTKGATSVTQNVPVGITKITGTSERVDITSFDNLPSGVSVNLAGAQCTPSATSPFTCSVSPIPSISVGTGVSAGTYIITVNARSVGGRVQSDTFPLTIASAPVLPVTVDIDAGLSSSGPWVEGPLDVTYGNPIYLRWSSANATDCEVRLITATIPDPGNVITAYNDVLNMSSTRRQSSGGMSNDALYRISCWNGGGAAPVPDEVQVRVTTNVDLDGPTEGDYGEDIILDSDYDGPPGASCTLTGPGVNEPVNPNDSTDVTLPGSGSDATYTITCIAPGGSTSTDTHTVTLNEPICFTSLNFKGGTTPTAAFILQDTNSQNSFSVDVVLTLNGFNPTNLNLYFDDIVQVGSASTPIVILSQSFTRNTDGSYTANMTLDNTRRQPAGEFSLRLIAEDTDGACADIVLPIPAYLIDQRENLGEQ